jgi:hypothetical protein
VTETKPLRGTHDLGEIVGYSYRVYLRGFVALFALALLTAPIELLSGVIDQSTDSEDVDMLLNLLQIPQLFVSLIVAAAIVHAVHEITGGQRPAFGPSLDAAFERLGALLSTFLLVVGLAFASAIAAPFLAIYWLFKKDATIDGQRNWWLAILPGALLIYLAVRWSFSTPAIMISRKQNWAALDDSADAVRGYWWRTLGIILVVTLITLGPTLVATTVSSYMPPLPGSALFAGVQALVLPFGVTAQTLLYYDLKARSAPATMTVEAMDEAEESQG